MFESRQFRVLGLEGLVFSLLLHTLEYNPICSVAHLLGYDGFFEKSA